MKAGISSLVDREIEVLLITGQRISISARGIRNIFFSLDSTVFFGASFGLVTFLFPVPAEVDIPWWMKLAGFSMFLGLLPLAYYFLIFLFSVISTFKSNLLVFEPLLLFFCAIFIELVDRTLGPLLFGEQWAIWLQTASFAHQVIATFILLLANDVLFCYFVLPRALLHKSL